MKNLEEKIFSDNTSGSLLSLSLEQELVKAVDKNWIKAIQGRARPDPRENRNTVQEIAPNVTDLSWQRFLSWTRLLDSCITVRLLTHNEIFDNLINHFSLCETVLASCIQVPWLHKHDSCSILRLTAVGVPKSCVLVVACSFVFVGRPT